MSLATEAIYALAQADEPRTNAELVAHAHASACASIAASLERLVDVLEGGDGRAQIRVIE
jgi:hypothetical protein